MGSIRLLDDWLKAYVELMENTEPAKLFDIWTGYSTIASALRRKVDLRLGRLVYYPNIYVVFVAEPGIARKTEAIKHGVEFLRTIPDIRLASDSTTKEALGDAIEEAKNEDCLSDGSIFAHSSLNIISKEFESFLGQKKENSRMLVALTDLFDCPDDWSARTRHSGTNAIVRPWLNILAATTPHSLASSLPATAVGGGFTTRVLFIFADRKKRAVAIPDMTPAELKLKESLEKDLFLISRLSGTYVMTNESINNWTQWYEAYNEDEGEACNRICTDTAFSGWYSRKPTYVLKIAMLRAASTSDRLTIEWHHIEEAIEEIKVVERLMGNAFRAMGKSEIAAEVDEVLQLIKVHRVISEKALMTLVWRNTAGKFDAVMDTILRSGKVVRAYKGPNGESGIWYFSKE